MKYQKCIYAFLSAAVLAAIPAHAAFLVTYNPPNGNGIDIVYGRAADAFTFSGAAVVNAVDFWYQTDVFGSPSDLSTVSYAIYANAGGVLGATVASGVATPTTTFDTVDNADFATFNLPSIPLGPGTYWLELHAGSSLTDTNNNLDIWWSNTDLVRPLDAMMASGASLPSTPVSSTGYQTLAFDLLGQGGSVDTSVPEPSAMLLLAVGGALVSVRRIWIRHGR